MRKDTKGADKFIVAYRDDNCDRQNMEVFALSLKDALIDAKRVLDLSFGQNYLIVDIHKL